MSATKSDLMDRYLQGVRFWLPMAQQQDILAELSEDLHSRIEDRESGLARPLSMDEFVAVLRERGTPMRVASSYLPEQRIVSPALVPVYLMMLKIALLGIIAPLAILAVIGELVISPHPRAATFIRIALAAWNGTFMAVGIVTTIFAALNYFHKTQRFENWDPRKLPRLPDLAAPKKRWNHLAASVSGLIAATFWIYLIGQRTGFSLPVGLHVELPSGWSAVYWFVLVVTLCSASIDMFSFIYPARVRTRTLARIGVDAVSLAGIGFLLTAAPWVTIANANIPTGELAKIEGWINIGIRTALAVIAAISVGDAVLEIRRSVRASHYRLISPSPHEMRW